MGQQGQTTRKQRVNSLNQGLARATRLTLRLAEKKISLVLSPRDGNIDIFPKDQLLVLDFLILSYFTQTWTETI
jgi:hypothetical protein